MNTRLIGSIGEMVRQQARFYGDKQLLIQGEQVRTYRQYDERTDRFAGGLLGLGLQLGDRVATYLKNSIELLEAYTGIAKAGGVTVCVNADLTPREIRYIFQDSGARFIITDEQHLDHVEQVLADCPAVQQVIVVGNPGSHLAFEQVFAAQPVELPVLDGSDKAFIIYTSGTTGMPKGAILTHRNLTWVAAACVDALGFRADDTFIVCLPLFHSYAVNTCYLQVIHTGATGVVLERFSTKAVLEAIEKHRATVMPGVPTMFAYLANYAERSRYDTSTLRMAVSAGAVLTEKVLADFQAAFGVKIYNGWGSTETATFATFDRVGGMQQPGSCGLPLPGCAIRIVDEEGRDCPPGVRGEMLVRGPNVMLGYQNKPDVTQATLKDGWYHTGDVAYLDENGYVFVVDRIKDVIISGGYNIAPKEVEDVILAHPAVLDVAVVGIPDEAKGQVIKAFVVLKDGQTATAEELLEECRGKLAAYKHPKAIEFCQSLPRTSSGKIKRYMLREGLTGVHS
ncbi:class I adenylate-forming enzyme family protein [Brevibacillus marinus]|uniref:class I adenylate-forming enzyme family protein n=1 Tax=Brevibacillus marinus TaxID=2496837 RepID=UPI000F84DC7D|nr:long-chain-fatty-acid--CoA ligase [Brevibacillus marinus]